MLEKLIAEIRAGGTLETGRLAARLGTTPEMVVALLEHLRMSGYIQEYSTCGDGCQGCNLKNACGSDKGAAKIRVWQGS